MNWKRMKNEWMKSECRINEEWMDKKRMNREWKKEWMKE